MANYHDRSAVAQVISEKKVFLVFFTLLILHKLKHQHLNCESGKVKKKP
jgi:hypothetical protein